MCEESNMETYITICKIDSQWEFVVCLRELKQGLCTISQGGRFRVEILTNLTAQGRL